MQNSLPEGSIMSRVVSCLFHSTEKIWPWIQGKGFSCSLPRIMFICMATMMLRKHLELPHHHRLGTASLHCLLPKCRWSWISNYMENKQVPSVEEWIAPGFIPGQKQWESSLDEGKPLPRKALPIARDPAFFFLNTVWVESLVLYCFVFHYYQLTTGVFH